MVITKPISHQLKKITESSNGHSAIILLRTRSSTSPSLSSYRVLHPCTISGSTRIRPAKLTSTKLDRPGNQRPARGPTQWRSIASCPRPARILAIDVKTQETPSSWSGKSPPDALFFLLSHVDSRNLRRNWTVGSRRSGPGTDHLFFFFFLGHGFAGTNHPAVTFLLDLGLPRDWVALEVYGLGGELQFAHGDCGYSTGYSVLYVQHRIKSLLASKSLSLINSPHACHGHCYLAWFEVRDG